MPCLTPYAPSGVDIFYGSSPFPPTHHAEAPLLAAGPGLLRLGDVGPVAVDVEVDAVAVDARRRVRLRTLQVPRRVHRRAHLGALQCHTGFNTQLSTFKRSGETLSIKV